LRDNETQTSGVSRREKADVYLLFEMKWNFRGVIACDKREAFAQGSALSAEARLRAKADATKQSILPPAPL
jgi:hypothetical protein